MSKEKIVQLRKETGIGYGDCRTALLECDGDLEEAKILLRKNNKFNPMSETSEGTIGCYLHHNGQLSAMVVLGCQTDFTANTSEFKELAKEIAIHVASTNPRCIDKDNIDLEHYDAEIVKPMLATHSGKPESILERIIEGARKKYLKQYCLLEQDFVKDNNKTVLDLLSDLSSRVGENITIKSFIRLSVSQ
jgi:elongation factor Ts